MSSAAAGDFVVVGEIVKAVGLKGEVKLYPLLDFHPDLLDSRYLSWSDGEPLQVIRHRSVSGGCVVVKLVGADDRNASENLIGRELGFRRSDYLADDFPRPAAGLPFRFIGREVVTVQGAALGIVDEVRRVGAGYLLVVPTDGVEVLIPAVAPILRPDAGLDGPLVIDPPEGLLDVYRG